MIHVCLPPQEEHELVRSIRDSDTDEGNNETLVIGI